MNLCLLLALLYAKSISVKGLQEHAWVLYGHGIIWYDYKAKKLVEIHPDDTNAKRLKGNDAKFAWPADYPVHFFIKHEELLPMNIGNYVWDKFHEDGGWDVHNWKSKSIQIGTASEIKGKKVVHTPIHESKGTVILVDQTVAKTQQIFNYHLYPAFDDEDSRKRTGIWFFTWESDKTGKKWKFTSAEQIDKSKWSPGSTALKKANPMSLKGFVESDDYKKRPAPVYWVACREKLTRNMPAPVVRKVSESDKTVSSFDSLIQHDGAHRYYDDNMYNGYDDRRRGSHQYRHIYNNDAEQQSLHPNVINVYTNDGANNDAGMDIAYLWIPTLLSVCCMGLIGVIGMCMFMIASGCIFGYLWRSNSTKNIHEDSDCLV